MDKIKKIVLLIINILFYAFIELKSLPLLIVLVLFSYYLTRKNNKINTIIGIVVVVLTWILFKSFINFLPLGLSFYSFKIISYIVDTYKGKVEAKHNLLDYAIYVSFFPQILSGPISKSNDVLSQTDNIFKFDKEKINSGILLIISGMFLKFVIANRCAVYVNNVVDSFDTKTSLCLLVASILYTIQIYADFAGYSNMSIGISNIIGLDIKPNFNKPYFATSIKDFWTRWHISLSTWLKDYIYIPLGGNRKGKLRKCINVLITFLVSGFWHGNGNGYILWGLYHGVFNLVPVKKTDNKIHKTIQQLVTFIIASFGWIFFRLEDIGLSFAYIGRMFTNIDLSFNGLIKVILPFTGDNTSISLALIIFIFIIIEWIIEAKKDNKSYLRYIFYIIAIILFGSFGGSGFIYMNY